MCSNITIFDDIFIEANETFGLSLILESTNFSAGVTLTPDNAAVVILDNDGLYSMYCYISYTLRPLKLLLLSIYQLVHECCKLAHVHV